ncbi:MAG: aminopeptidase P family protein [Armatimonadetes bacterium]|nr:aminopeptidase P family protein [Armatimonadota bacterium]
MTLPIYADRLARARAALAEAGTDALLLTPGANLLYLTGFEPRYSGERLLAFILQRDGAALWITPAMNQAEVEQSALPGQQMRVWMDEEWHLPSLRDATAGLKTVAFDDETRAAFLLDLLAIAPEVRVGKASGVMRGLRTCKDAAELAALRAAARTVDETIPEVLALCRPGRREMDVEEALRGALRRHSPESEVAFSIVASGPNSALPHHHTGGRELRHGDVVVLDYGTRLRWYHSDITVTCTVGEPADPEVRKVYRSVWEAQQKALAAIRPGVACAAVDAAARESIRAAGYGEYFIHRTGHGIGLDVHEPPYLVAGNEEPLAEGMCFSVEPGIYLPGRFGVRLEVIATVTASGVELLNAPSSPELLDALVG